MKRALNSFGSCATVGMLIICLWPAAGAASEASTLDSNASAPQSTPLPPAGARDPKVLAATKAWNGTPGQSNHLQLNFKGAPLKLVLEYLSEAAGFVIDQETEITGTVDAWSKEPVTREEAVALLNSSLRKNGAGVMRQGRILKVLKLDAAKTADLEIAHGNNPDTVQKSEELVTQIIPVRYAKAGQLTANLQSLLPTTASLTANESANSLVLVASQTDVRRVLKIISALDSSIAHLSSIKVLPLRYSDARQLATSLQQLFAPQSNPQGNEGQSLRFDPGRGFEPAGGFPGSFGPGGFSPGIGGIFAQSGGGGAPVGSSVGAGAAARNPKVAIVGDDYSNSLVVSAPAEILETITDTVRQVDQPATDIVELRVFRLANAEPAEIVEQLTQLFPAPAGNEGNQTEGEVRFGPPGAPIGPLTGTEPAPDSSSDRAQKKARMLAVADPRTSSVLVSAGSRLMPEVAKLIERLDRYPGKKELVKIWDLQTANPQSVNQVLQDLFNRNGSMRNNNNSLLGENDALSARQNQQQGTTQNGFDFQGGGAEGLGGSNSGRGAGN